MASHINSAIYFKKHLHGERSSSDPAFYVGDKILMKKFISDIACGCLSVDQILMVTHLNFGLSIKSSQEAIES